jgi:hypothetical protein
MPIGGFGPDGLFLEGQTPSKELDAIGQIPLLVEELGVSSWKSAVLLNDIDYSGPAWAIYSSDITVSRIGVKFWSNRFPSGAPTANAMPQANISGMWGDYHILGDIKWLANRQFAFSESNAARFPHGLWFSQPDAADSWDPIDVQFIGQRDVDNRVLGMFPVSAGLIVISTNGAHMLRGSADLNEYELIRPGIGPNRKDSVAFWPAAGIVVWVDKRGQVWQTNGETFGRMDTVLPPVEGPCPSSVGAFDDFLLVSRAGRMYAMRIYDGQGVWTELNADCTREIHRYEGSIYTAKTGRGLERFAPEYPKRGALDDVPIGSKVSTPTLQFGDQHKRTFWHRFGARLRGDGRLLRAFAKPAPALSDANFIEYGEDDGTGDRLARVYPAHGPSKEASFTVEAEGDVTYESMTVWYNDAKNDR